MKKILFFLLFILGTIQGMCQDIELGKVSVNDLQQKQHGLDTSAVAAVIFNRAKTSFKYNPDNGFSIGTEFQIRIKIYKKEGLNWATFKVPFYIGYEEKNDESVQFSDAVTYNLVNGAIEKSKLKSEGSFVTKINEYWKEASITLPNVKVGSIIEFKYFLKSENIVKFPSFNFQYDIPVNFARFTTAIPGFFVYKGILSGYIPVQTVQKITTGSFSYPVKADRTRSEFVTFEQTVTTYSAENIPALTPEPFVDNLQNYRAILKHELEKTQFYQEPVKDYATTWAGVSTSIFEDKDFGQQLEFGVHFLTDVKEVIKNDTNTPIGSEEKMSRIFTYVQQRMNWNNENGYYSDKGVKEAYAHKTGNSAEINFILINMLRIAGVDANPVLVSTIDHGVPAYPNRTGFNYVIASATIDGKNVLLDATNKFTVPNVLPLKLLNWQGRLIRKDGTSEEINLVPKEPSTLNYNLFAKIDSSGKIDGKLKVYHSGTEALLLRENHGSQDENAYLEKLENKWNGLEISEYGIEENKAVNTQPISERLNFTTNNYCEIIAGKLYINPMLFLTSSINPFVQEKRDMPIYFAYRKNRKYNFNIDIPLGYEVEFSPKPIKISTQGKEVTFSFNSALVGNTIQIVISEEVNSAIFPADFYPELKSFYQNVINKQNEKIILKKI